MKEFKLNEYRVVMAIAESDRMKDRTDEIFGELQWAKRVALVKPGVFRECKSRIMHELGQSDGWGEEDNQIYKRLYSWIGMWGRDSRTFNTLIRTVSIAQFTVKQVQNRRLKEKSIPPAFDSLRRATKTASRDKLREELELFVRNAENPWINQIKRAFKREVTKYENKSERTVEILTNGTTTGIEWEGFNINDIMGVVFIPNAWDTKWLGFSRFFKLENDYNTERNLYYVKLGENEKCDNYGGEHMIIPDKDGKEREVYRLYPWIQIFSKSMHKFLDNVVKSLEGNYSYKHRQWLRNIVQKGWNKTKYIIGTDMSKYSDTLDRSFIIFLLKEFGMPESIIKNIDDLYSQDIFDSLLLQGYSGTKATFQGQYGDFPMITLCNLVLQCFVYHKLNLICDEGYRAAVGDDTGMVFDEYRSDILDTVVEVYGCVGVNINRDKTSVLTFGKGRIEFVKLELTCDGIIDFFNLRSIHSQNIDAIIRDVFSLESTSDDEKLTILQTMFGNDEGNRLMNLSIINGGLRNEPISKTDLNIYYNRSVQLARLLGYSEDETKRWLIYLKDYLERTTYGEYSLKDTALIGWVNNEEILSTVNKGLDLDDTIIMNILNMIKLGLTGPRSHKEIVALLGQKPLDLKAEWDKPETDKNRDNYKAYLWESLMSYESFASQRRAKDEFKKRKVSTMVPLMLGFFEGIENTILPDCIFYNEIKLANIAEYEKSVIHYKARNNIEHIKQLVSGVGNIFVNEYFGCKYHYISMTDGKKRVVKRLYTVEWRSKYESFSRDDFDEYFGHILKGRGITYDDMMLSWREAQKATWLDWNFVKLEK